MGTRHERRHRRRWRLAHLFVGTRPLYQYAGAVRFRPAALLRRAHRSTFAAGSPQGREADLLVGDIENDIAGKAALLDGFMSSGDLGQWKAGADRVDERAFFQHDPQIIERLLAFGGPEFIDQEELQSEASE